MLEPETATVLADGDVITFGKSVGRDKDLVLPVVARVQLLFSPSADIAPPLPERITLSPDTAPSEQSPAPGTSGRYGIYVSSDSSASSSDGDSDIEEIPPPAPFSPPLRMMKSSQSSQASNLSGRLQLLRNLLPAVPSTCVDEPTPTAFAQLLALPMPGAIDRDSSPESSSSAESYAKEDDDLYMNEPSMEPGQIQFDDWHSLYEPPSPRQPASDFEVPRAPSMEAQPPSLVGGGPSVVGPLPGQFDIRNDRPIAPELTVSLTALEGRIQTAQEDISLLRHIRTTDEERFDVHVREVKARLAALDEAIRAPAPFTAERSAAITEVVARMDTLQGKMSVLESRAADVGPREDGLREIKAMLEEIKTIRENGEKQIALELEAVRIARAQAEAAAAEAVARLAVNPLKRKRSEDDDLGEDETSDPRVVAPIPKRRRMARRVATMLARTVTVATVGAVATWTALAFA